MATSARTLKARAIAWLALREHSRVELRRKLLPHATAEAEAEAEGEVEDEAEAGGRAGRGAPRAEVASPVFGDGGDAARAAASARVDALLDWLETQGHLSGPRFVEARVRAREAKFGHRRIEGELRQHRLELPIELQQTLRQSELSRARALHDRRFGAPSPALEPGERARRARFLVGRGFAHDVIVRVLRGATVGEADDGDAG